MNRSGQTIPSFSRERKASTEAKTAGPSGMERTVPGRSGDMDSLYFLQRTIGNQEVIRLLRPDPLGFTATDSGSAAKRVADMPARSSLHAPTRPAIQPKLAFSIPGDVCEQEADRVADQVVGMTESSVFAPFAPSLPGKSPASGDGALLVQGFWEELGGLLQGGADLASGRWVWDPISRRLDEWERELDRIGEESGLGVGTNVMLSVVSLLYVILRAITGTLDLLARLNPYSIVLQEAATGIRITLSENPQAEISRIAEEAGQVALDIITLGLLRAYDHLREGIREANVFRITEAVGEIALAVLAIIGIFRAVRGLRAARASRGGSTPPPEPAPEQASVPPEPVPEQASVPPQEQASGTRPRGRQALPGTPDLTVPRHLLALQSRLEQIFNRLGGGSGWRILVCDDATLIETRRSSFYAGRSARGVGGAQTDPTLNVIWVHEELVRNGGLVRRWGSRLNLNQVVAHEIGHARGAGATECHLASRTGANLPGLTPAESLGMLDDAVQIARRQNIPLDALDLPPGYTPPPPPAGGGGP